ncbi:MAG: hypothetical protein ACQETT_03960 [Pseudomonadota bacterium]
MSIRQFNGRIFFKDKAINLKIGGPVSDDGQQTVIAMDESTHSLRIIRCDMESLDFQQLAELLRDEFNQMDVPLFPSENGQELLRH